MRLQMRYKSGMKKVCQKNKSVSDVVVDYHNWPAVSDTCSRKEYTDRSSEGRPSGWWMWWPEFPTP